MIGGKRYLYLLLLTMLLVMPALQIDALELSASFDLGNLGFKTDRASSETGYTGNEFLWGGSIEFEQSITENMMIEGGMYRDSVLRNIVDVIFLYRFDYLSIGLGSFNGVFNTSGTILKPGVYSTMQIGIPGIFFVYLSTGSSLGGGLVNTGDYIQERSDISLGYYVHNAICSLNIQSLKFTEKQASEEVADSLVAYSFKTDIYQKNLPYRLILTFTYQTLSKQYGSVSPTVHTLGSLILGTEFVLDISSILSIRLNLDSSIHTFGRNDLTGVSIPITSGYLFRASTGFTLNLEKVKESR